MNDAAQIRRCNSAPRANRPLLQTPDPKISNRESRRLPQRSNRENNAWFLNRVRALNTRRSSITQFNKQSRKRGLKAPSVNVSVKKKSIERFQQLTQNLNVRMFRLDRMRERKQGERKFSRWIAAGLQSPRSIANRVQRYSETGV